METNDVNKEVPPQSAEDTKHPMLDESDDSEEFKDC